MNRNASTCRSALLLCGALLLLGGCASRWQDLFVSYSDQMVPLRNQLLLGHAAEALPKVRESTPGDDTYVLDQLEKGRIAWLAGQDAISKQGFAAAASIPGAAMRSEITGRLAEVALESGAAMLVDEKRGRAAAAGLGLSVVGTLGILARAREDAGDGRDALQACAPQALG